MTQLILSNVAQIQHTDTILPVLPDPFFEAFIGRPIPQSPKKSSSNSRQVYPTGH